MGPAWVQEIFDPKGKQEELPQDVRQWAINAFRSAILEIMINRFELMDYKTGKAIEDGLDTIEDLLWLRRLVVEAATVASPEEFAAQLQA